VINGGEVVGDHEDGGAEAAMATATERTIRFSHAITLLA
jgi:hypothetical protein